MEIKLNNILKYLDEMNFNYTFMGNKDMSLERYSSLNSLKNHSITWIKNKSYYKEELISEMKEVLIILDSEIIVESLLYKDNAFIFCHNPKEVFFMILNHFFPQEKYKKSISPSSKIDGKIVGSNVYIGHNTYIGKEVTIEDNVVIKNNVSIEGRVYIGKNTIIHSGVVIGTDGFGYFKNDKGQNMKVPHYGGVIIGENVEIGANSCIDRGTLDDTFIGDYVKISNLCHIAHNVIIKENCMITASCMISGSVVIEKDSYIAPGVTIRNQLTIGKDVLVGMGAVVVKDIEDNKVVTGIPAKVIRDNL